MSGGSYDYAYRRVQDTVDTLRTRHPNQPHVLALADHLARVAIVLGDIEWADSGDTSWDDELDAKIRALLQPGDPLAVAIDKARAWMAVMNAEIDRVADTGAEP